MFDSSLQLQEMESGASDQTVVYRIDVVTGTAIGAGTDANIFCTLGGDRFRSSGEFLLETSLLHANKFERGQVRFVPPRAAALRCDRIVYSPRTCVFNARCAGRLLRMAREVVGQDTGGRGTHGRQRPGR